MNELLKHLLLTYWDVFPNSFYSKLPSPEAKNEKDREVILTDKIMEDQSEQQRAIEIVFKDLLPNMTPNEFTDLSDKAPDFVFGLLNEDNWKSNPYLSEMDMKLIANRVHLDDILVKNLIYAYYQLQYPVIKSRTALIVDESLNQDGYHNANWYAARLFCSDRIDYLNNLDDKEIGMHKEFNKITNRDETICQVNLRIGLFQFLYATEKFSTDFQHEDIFSWIKSKLTISDMFRLSIEAITEEYYHKNCEIIGIWDLIKMGTEAKKAGMPINVEYKASRYIYDNVLEYCIQNKKGADSDIVTLMERI